MGFHFLYAFHVRDRFIYIDRHSAIQIKENEKNIFVAIPKIYESKRKRFFGIFAYNFACNFDYDGNYVPTYAWYG